MDIYAKVVDLLVALSNFSALLASDFLLDAHCNFILHSVLWMTVSILDLESWFLSEALL